MIEKNPCPKTKKKNNIYKRHILQQYTSAVYVGCNKLAYSWCFKYKIYLYNFSEQQFWFFDYIIIVEHSSVHIYETFLYKSKHVTNFCLMCRYGSYFIVRISDKRQYMSHIEYYVIICQIPFSLKYSVPIRTYSQIQAILCRFICNIFVFYYLF